MLENLKAKNQKRWESLSINSSAISQLDKVATRLVAAKDRYLAVSKKTNVPWFIIAVIHEREASQSWFANLAQGDRWDRVSTHIPRGQGPFKSWEEAAINALHSDHLDTWGDWSPGGALTALEKYNGLGYANKGKPSPYIWSKTNQYTSGKYVADGVYNPDVVDVQNGCAALIKRMQALDSSIKFGTPTAAMPLDAHTKAAGAVIVAGGTATAVASQHPHIWPYVLLGTAVLALVTWLLIRKFK